MLERVAELPGVELDVAGYLDDFWARRAKLTGVFWKLERIQTFREPDVPSWVAMRDGDWARSLRLAEEMRGEIAAEFARAGRLEMRRIRVVERPVSAYLQWEFQVLRLRAAAGERVRVVGPDAIRGLEERARLPELVVLGTETMYQVRYDNADTVLAARRIDDPWAVAGCIADLTELYLLGEDLPEFFAKEIAPLPAPVPAA